MLSPSRDAERTKAWLVEKEVAFAKGDLYSPDVLERSQRDIYDEGVFSSVSIRAVPPEKQKRLEPEPADPRTPVQGADPIDVAGRSTAADPAETASTAAEGASESSSVDRAESPEPRMTNEVWPVEVRSRSAHVIRSGPASVTERKTSSA